MTGRTILLNVPDVTVALVPTTCSTCGVVFGLPDNLDRARRRDGAGFYCPNGHTLLFRKTEADHLREQLEAERRNRAAAQDYALAVAAERDAAERSARALRGVVTRTKRRAAAGTCPAGCRRHFTNLERHMTTQHPDYATPADAEGHTP